jgi:hypothetical protein
LRAELEEYVREHPELVVATAERLGWTVVPPEPNSMQGAR